MTDTELLTKEPKALQQLIIDFITEEKQRGLSYKSLAIQISAIKHFLPDKVELTFPTYYPD